MVTRSTTTTFPRIYRRKPTPLEQRFGMTSPDHSRGPFRFGDRVFNLDSLCL